MQIGQIFAGYRLDQPLGRPQGVEWWRALPISAQNQASGGAVRIEIASGLEQSQRPIFEREFSCIGQPQKGALLPLLNAGFLQSGEAFVVYPDISGESIDDLLAQDALPTCSESMLILSQLAQVIADFHASRRPYGGLGGSSVFWDGASRQTALLPFASILLRLFSSRDMRALSFSAYAPEYLSQKSLGGGGDIYAIGCLMYLLVGGELPFRGNAESVARQHLQSPAPRLSDVAPMASVPPELDLLAQHCMAKEVQKRPRALAVANALQQLSAKMAREEARYQVGSRAPQSMDPLMMPSMGQGAMEAQGWPQSGSRMGQGAPYPPQSNGDPMRQQAMRRPQDPYGLPPQQEPIFKDEMAQPPAPSAQGFLQPQPPAGVSSQNLSRPPQSAFSFSKPTALPSFAAQNQPAFSQPASPAGMQIPQDERQSYRAGHVSGMDEEFGQPQRQPRVMEFKRDEPESEPLVFPNDPRSERPRASQLSMVSMPDVSMSMEFTPLPAPDAEGLEGSRGGIDASMRNRGFDAPSDYLRQAAGQENVNLEAFDFANGDWASSNDDSALISMDDLDAVPPSAPSPANRGPLGLVPPAPLSPVMTPHSHTSLQTGADGGFGGNGGDLELEEDGPQRAGAQGLSAGAEDAPLELDLVAMKPVTRETMSKEAKAAMQSLAQQRMEEAAEAHREAQKQVEMRSPWLRMRLGSVLAGALVVLAIGSGWVMREKLASVFGVNDEKAAVEEMVKQVQESDPAKVEEPEPEPPPPPPKPKKVESLRPVAPSNEPPPPPARYKRHESVLVQTNVTATFTVQSDPPEEICTEKKECFVPINVDVLVQAPGHRDYRLSGDDLYDRRGRQWKIILQAGR